MKAEVTMAASGKGGTGKTTVSILLGARLAAMGHPTLVIELDTCLRSADIISGVCADTVYDIGDVLCGRCSGEKAAAESPLYPGLSVISAPYEGGVICREALARLVEEMAPRYDHILIDTASGLGEAFEAAASVSDRALLVLTPDQMTLRGGRTAADRLLELGPEKINLVMNRVDRSCFFEGAVLDLDECIDTVGAQLLAVIPESTGLRRAAVSGKALTRECTAFAAINNLARRMCGFQVPLAVR